MTEVASGSDNVLSSLSSIPREEFERHLECQDVGRQSCAVKSPACTEKFVSTRETAKSRWPFAYVKFRHSVADQLGRSV